MADKKHFLRSQDLSASEVETLFWLARRLKRERAEGHLRSELRGRHIALYLEKPSVRTRVSFTVAARELGADVVELNAGQTKLGQGEHPQDFAAVLSRYCHAIVARVHADASLTQMTKGATVPVINALSDGHHPCQALADYFTLRERFSNLKGLKVAYVGDAANNVARSLIELGKQLGVELRVAAPEGYQPEAEVAEGVLVTTDPKQAVEGVHAIYTDTWVSMGAEASGDERRKALAGYKVDEALLAGALPEAVVMHCLPAVRDEEIETSVLLGPRSVVLDQAENRLHTQKALLLLLVENRSEPRAPRDQHRGPQGDRGPRHREGGRDGNREGGNREGGNREGGNREGGRPQGDRQQQGGRGPRQGGQGQGGEQRPPRQPRPEGQRQPRPEGGQAPAEGGEQPAEGQAADGQQPGGEGQREGQRRRRRRGRGRDGHRGEGQGQSQGGEGGSSEGGSGEGGSGGGSQGGSGEGGSNQGGSSQGGSGGGEGGSSQGGGSNGGGSNGGEGGGSSGGSGQGSAEGLG